MNPTAILGHVALVTTDPTAMATFYREFLDLEVTLQGSLPQLGEFAFLSGQPDAEFAELAFVTNPNAKHIALRVESLAALKALHAKAKRQGIPIPFALNHKGSLSMYLRDPEGNLFEVYWATGEKPNAPYAEPIDLERPEAELLEAVSALGATRALSGRSPS